MASQTYKNSVQEWDEKLLQCPYIPSHQIRPERMGHHLVTCRRSLSKQPTSPYYSKLEDLQVCQFNSQHHIPKDKMKEHIKKCQGIVTVLKGQQPSGPQPFNSSDDGISDIMSGVSLINSHQDDDDDWDDDVQAYDPSVKASQMPMHLPAGLTPAERRDYRLAKRHGEILDFNNEVAPQQSPEEEEVVVGQKIIKKGSEMKLERPRNHEDWDDHNQSSFSNNVVEAPSDEWAQVPKTSNKKPQKKAPPPMQKKAQQPLSGGFSNKFAALPVEETVKGKGKRNGSKKK